MKFKCERDILLKEISIAYEVISSKNILSILSNVFLEVTDKNILNICATDLKVGFESSISVEVSISGKTTVFCEKLLGILKNLPSGEIEFELKENMLLYIKPISHKISFKLKSIASDKFPELQKTSGEKFFEFSQKDFIKMISNTIFAISDDEMRYFMNGVCLEKNNDKIKMIASDGKRLSFISKSVNPSVNDIKNAIIPPKILNIVKKLMSGEGNLFLCITDKNIFIKFANHCLSSNLIDGQFPNYSRVIPEEQTHKVIINKDILEKAIKRASLLVEHKSRRIFLKFVDNTLIISSEESEIGMANEEIACDYKDEEIIITLNYIYLIEPLMDMTDDKVSIEFTNKSKAITIKSVPEKDFLHIIMPMQTK